MSNKLSFIQMATPIKPEQEMEVTTPKKKKNIDLNGYYHKITSPSNSETRVTFTLQGKRKSHRVLCYAPTREDRPHRRK